MRMEKISDGCKALFQIGNDVVNMLCADGEADGRLCNALIGKLLLSELRMGRGRRMDDQ